MRILLLLPLVLASCVGYADMYGNKYGSAGGDADVTFPGGGHLTHSHTASFQHFTQAVTTVVGGIAVAQASKAKTASDNIAATTQLKNASDAKTAQQALANEAADKAGKQAIATKALETGQPIPAKP